MTLPLIITSNHYGNSVIRTGGRGVLHTPHITPRMGRMIRRPDTCGAYAIRPYPTGRRGGTQKQKNTAQGMD